MKNTFGYLYILSNEFSPGLLKIGFTTKSVEERASELYTTGVPTKFTIDYKIKITDPFFWESKVHKALADKRINKEWFKLSLEDAIKVINAVVGSEPIFAAKISEVYDIEKLVDDATEEGYDYYFRKLTNDRALYMHAIVVLIDNFYIRFRDDLFKRSGFISSFNGKLNRNFDKISDFRMASIVASSNIEFEPIKTRNDFKAYLHELLLKDPISAKHFSKNLLINSSYIFSEINFANYFYESPKKIDFKNLNISIHQSDKFNEWSRFFSDVHSQVVLENIVDPVLHFIIQQGQSRINSYYKFDLLSSFFHID